MKKLWLLAAAMVLALSLAACSSGKSTAEIDNDLQGVWYCTLTAEDVSIDVAYVFGTENSFMLMSSVDGSVLTEEYGTYEISDGEIIAAKENGDEVVLTYSYAGDDITVLAPNGMELTYLNT